MMRRTKLRLFPWQGVPLLLFLVSCSPENPPLTAWPSVDAENLRNQGRLLYEQSCANCHLVGQGGEFMPPLRNAASVSGDTGHLIRIILQGQTGVSVINGRKLSGGMPPQDYLTNLEIAAICSYIRHEFTGIEKPVQPAEVAAARSSLFPGGQN